MQCFPTRIIFLRHCTTQGSITNVILILDVILDYNKHMYETVKDKTVEFSYPGLSITL